MNLIHLQQADPKPFASLFDAIFSNHDPEFRNHKWSKADVLYFGGGTDVNPALYDEPRGAWSNIPDYVRDAYEHQLFRTRKDIVGGFIGVCRGSQFLTAMNGGKIVQHIGENHCDTHQIQTWDGKVFDVTSTHHQMMYPFNLFQDQYQILGWSYPGRLAEFYQAGDHTFYKPDTFVREPEIVWYPKTRTLCIQGHPEYLDVNHPFPTYCRQLIKQFLL